MGTGTRLSVWASTFSDRGAGSRRRHRSSARPASRSRARISAASGTTCRPPRPPDFGRAMPCAPLKGRLAVGRCGAVTSSSFISLTRRSCADRASSGTRKSRSCWQHVIGSRFPCLADVAKMISQSVLLSAVIVGQPMIARASGGARHLTAILGSPRRRPRCTGRGDVGRRCHDGRRQDGAMARRNWSHVPRCLSRRLDHLRPSNAGGGRKTQLGGAARRSVRREARSPAG